MCINKNITCVYTRIKMTDNTDKNTNKDTTKPTQPESIPSLEETLDLTPTEEDLKKRLQELRKRDPFIYR
jgi:hypothetical protein